MSTNEQESRKAAQPTPVFGYDLGSPDGDCTVEGHRNADGSITIDKVTYAQPAPERQGEVVAWLCDNGNRENLVVTNSVRGRDAYAILGRKITPLYTHPAAPVGVGVPDGMVLVPVDATPAMQAAGGHANSEWLNDNAPLGENRYGGPVMRSVWQAMLAAAPSTPDNAGEAHE